MFSSKFQIVHFTCFINVNKCIFVVIVCMTMIVGCLQWWTVDVIWLKTETILQSVLQWHVQNLLHSSPPSFIILRYAILALKLWCAIFFCLFLVLNEFIINSIEIIEFVLSRSEDKTAFEFHINFGMKYWHRRLIPSNCILSFK